LLTNMSRALLPNNQPDFSSLATTQDSSRNLEGGTNPTGESRGEPTGTGLGCSVPPPFFTVLQEAFNAPFGLVPLRILLLRNKADGSVRNDGWAFALPVHSCHAVRTLVLVPIQGNHASTPCPQDRKLPIQDPPSGRFRGWNPHGISSLLVKQSSSRGFSVRIRKSTLFFNVRAKLWPLKRPIGIGREGLVRDQDRPTAANYTVYDQTSPLTVGTCYAYPGTKIGQRPQTTSFTIQHSAALWAITVGTRPTSAYPGPANFGRCIGRCATL
jgi:hypothetical protein